ncbi:MAG: SAM-dependent methyltransferase, partial [Planctomycetota bacterium]
MNQFNVLDEPVYYTSVQKVLSVDSERFFDDYVYNVRPATDDKPYFFDFFKWKSLPYMARSVRGRWLPYTEWGYLVVVVTLLQSLVISLLLILLPLFVVRLIRQQRRGRMAAFAYFGLLGFCYMFLEMGFIQKLTLLTGKPVFGVAVTLLSFLVFSGIGS